MRILRYQDYRRMRWKNGGGETTEIVVSPDGAGLDAFDWRVSMAHVASDGPFSLFPNIDRTLAVLDGHGIRLRVAGLGEFDLTTASVPLAFPADAPAGADLIDGPIHDLNVMSRRGVVRHALTRAAISEPYRINLGADATLLLIRGSEARFQSAAHIEAVAGGDSVILDKADGEATLTPSSALTLYICEFRRV
ncbi:MAG: HutD family protein [Pseudolabrys sp.]|jgi:hypothetical protein